MLLFLLRLKMFSGRGMREPWSTTTSHRGDSPPFRPSDAALLALITFCCLFFFLPPRFCSAAPSVCPALVKPVLHIHGALCLDAHPLHSPFSLQKNGMRCKSESIHPGFLDVCQTAPEQQHDLFCAQISTVYTLLALLREGGKGRDRRGENILSIYRILAARHHFILPMM